MTKKNFLDDISDKVASLLPKAEALGSEMKGELNAKIQSAIKSSLESLDVVTREEFDAQAAMLARAEARVADGEETGGEAGLRHAEELEGVLEQLGGEEAPVGEGGRG